MDNKKSATFAIKMTLCACEYWVVWWSNVNTTNALNQSLSALLVLLNSHTLNNHLKIMPFFSECLSRTTAIIKTIASYTAKVNHTALPPNILGRSRITAALTIILRKKLMIVAWKECSVEYRYAEIIVFRTCA